MDFDLSEEQRMALDAWRRFIDRDIRPITDEYRDTLIPAPVLKKLLGMTAEYGVGCGWVPEDGGGAGLDFLTSGLPYEELARVSPDLAGAAFVNEGAPTKVFHAGSAGRRARSL